MHRKLRICVFNTMSSRDQEFQNLLEKVEGVEFVGLASDWDELGAMLSGGLADVALINLDENVDFGVNLVQRVARTMPEISILGLSSRSDPQTIIQAMRAGCAQFVCYPIDLKDLNSALERIRQTIFGVGRKSRRICVLGATGGAGCTTIACNLAMELAHLTDETAALVDLNLEFGDINCAFDCDPKYTISDLCQCTGTVDRMMVESAMHELPSKVAILSGPQRIEDARLVTAQGIKQVLSVMAASFSNVIVDMPRAFHSETATALEGADLILIVSQLNVAGIRNAARIYEFLQSLGASRDSLEIVLNRCQADHGNVTPDDVEQHFSRPVFGKIPNDYKKVMSARDLGHPIAADAPSSAARLAIQEMAKKIAVEYRCDDKKRDSRGLIGRILAKKA